MKIFVALLAVGLCFCYASGQSTDGDTTQTKKSDDSVSTVKAETTTISRKERCSSAIQECISYLFQINPIHILQNLEPKFLQFKCPQTLVDCIKDEIEDGINEFKKFLDNFGKK